ncbi:MAG: argininosuccinate lyase, partial [Flavobacteriaceae bacterium]|nr:argininosuccinate lyase [Flavobacteriaceae bacterium]
FSLEQIQVNPNILKDEMYDYLFSVEAVNKLVQQGMPFRDAYKTVGKQIQDKTFSPQRKVKHTHAGSIGNLCLNEISAKMKVVFEQKI